MLKCNQSPITDRYLYPQGKEYETWLKVDERRLWIKP